MGMILDYIKKGLKAVSDFVVSGIRKGYEYIKSKSAAAAKVLYKYFVLLKDVAVGAFKGMYYGMELAYEEWKYIEETGALDDEDEDELYEDDDFSEEDASDIV